MLKDLLKLFQDRPRTMCEISSVLGLDKEEVQNRLDQMVRMGFLEEMKGGPVEEHAVEMHCLGCGLCRQKSCFPTGRSYRLMEKGIKVVQSS